MITIESIQSDVLEELYRDARRCDDLERAIREMWLLIEEHGGPVIKAHATELMRTYKIIHEGDL